MVVRESRGSANRRALVGGAALVFVLALLGLPPAALAQDACTDAAGAAVPPVAHLVSLVGDVRVGERPLTGEAPYRPICAGESVVVGQGSRALVNLIGADTPLRLDENSISRSMQAWKGPRSICAWRTRGPR